MRWFYLLFFAVPIAEMYLLITVGGIIGPLPTVAAVMLTAVIGVALLRRQGLATLTRAQQRMQVGEMPAEEMLEGIGLALAGAFLLTPGFITDTAGFVLLVPGLRRAIVAPLAASFVPVGPSAGPRSGAGQAGRRAPPGDVIEGEYEKKAE